MVQSTQLHLGRARWGSLSLIHTQRVTPALAESLGAPAWAVPSGLCNWGSPTPLTLPPFSSPFRLMVGVTQSTTGHIVTMMGVTAAPPLCPPRW